VTHISRLSRLLASVLTGVALLLAPSISLTAAAPSESVLTLPSAHATAGSWTLVDDARLNILQGNIKVTDAFKVALFATSGAVTTSSTTYSTLTGEVGTTNTGYATGGQAVTLSTTGTTSVAVYFASNPSWTAGSANLAAYQAVLYDSSTGYILAFANLDSGGALVTTTSGQVLTIADSSGNPVVTFSGWYLRHAPEMRLAA